MIAAGKRRATSLANPVAERGQIRLTRAPIGFTRKAPYISIIRL